MEHDLSLKEIQKEWHGSLKSYFVGFISCVVLTSISFYLVVEKPFATHSTIYVIAALALVQAVFQLLLFLHVGQEAKPKWETIVFFFMFMLLSIIAIGSLWIMHDLSVRVMNM